MERRDKVQEVKLLVGNRTAHTFKERMGLQFEIISMLANMRGWTDLEAVEEFAEAFAEVVPNAF